MPYALRLRLWGMGLVAPTIAFFLVFKFGPMLWALWLAFTTYDMVRPPSFVGLENFLGLARDPVFTQALENTLVYVAASTGEPAWTPRSYRLRRSGSLSVSYASAIARKCAAAARSPGLISGWYRRASRL